MVDGGELQGSSGEGEARTGIAGSRRRRWWWRRGRVVYGGGAIGASSSRGRRRRNLKFGEHRAREREWVAASGPVTRGAPGAPFYRGRGGARVEIVHEGGGCGARLTGAVVREERANVGEIGRLRALSLVRASARGEGG